MKTLVKTQRSIPWFPQPGEGRLYITDELPSVGTAATAFGFAFEEDGVLLIRLRNRDWDIPGGGIEPGETAGEAAVREVREEACAEIEILEPVGIQELELFGPRPAGLRWPFPISVQVYFLCRIVILAPFQGNEESRARAFFEPDRARLVPTMVNHDMIYEEALRRVIGSRPSGLR